MPTDLARTWRVARTTGELFAADDEPRCFFGRCFVFWALDPELGGHSTWGFPDLADTEDFISVLELARARARRPRTLIVDFADLTGIQPAGFERLRGWLARNPEPVPPRAVIVRPSGLLGAVVAGFHEVLGTGAGRPVVTTLAEACAVLGRADALGALDELARLRAQRVVGGDVVDRLRVQLEGDEPPDGLDAAARRLALSPRTLQDQLRRAGTTFRDEQRAARLVRAKRLVRAGVKLTAVALEVGFSTPQQFATWFKRHVGVTPSAWRARDGQPPR